MRCASSTTAKLPRCRRRRTLPADNLDDPAVHLLAMGLVEVVNGRLQATQAGYDLRKLIERER
jgi:hypothetical protein